MNHDEQNRENACNTIRDHTTALNSSAVDDIEESSGIRVTVCTEGDNTDDEEDDSVVATVVVEVSCNQNSKNRYRSNMT